MLPHVAALNLLSGSSMSLTSPNLGISGSINQSDATDGITSTTSQHYTWVQSDHPYKPASVSNYRYYFFVNCHF